MSSVHQFLFFKLINIKSNLEKEILFLFSIEDHFETDVLGKNHVGLAFISGKKNKKTNEWDI